MTTISVRELVLFVSNGKKKWYEVLNSNFKVITR
jgi:hypothetical protein